MELNTGKELQNGKYRILGILGQGGFGITYLAEQTSLGRKVAIKEFFMKDLCNRDDDGSHVSVPSVGSKELVERFRQKFLKEARSIASLEHKHIVPIIDVFEENGTAYYVMKYFGGGSLSACTALSEEKALRYIRQIASAIGFIHSRHMMHLDIKPGNILLDSEDNAIVIDFGLAKQYDEAGHQTSTTPVGISHGYAPLEQYKAGGVSSFSPATDIYSLGATLYRLLTDNRPADAMDLVSAPFPACPANVSASTWNAVKSAMQPAISSRPQSVKEFLGLVESGEWKDESGEMRDERAKSKDERAKSKDETSLSMGTGQNAANGNAAVEENEIEVEVVEVPSAAQKPASEPKQPKEKKSSKGLWIVILLLLVIGGAAGGFMFFGGGGDVKKDSAKDTSVQQPPIVDPVPVVEQTAELVITGAPDGANVYVDGKYFDETPLKGATISIGEHTIKVVKEGYETYEKTHIFNSQSAAIDVNIKKSTALLNLSTNPSGASVYVDGSYIGTSYISGYKVEQGRHTIKITKQGYKDIVETHNFSSGSKNLSFNLSEKDITPSEAYSKGVVAYNKKDYSEAAKWYRKAAEQGHAGAQNWLGVLYERGHGVSPSWSEAVKWYRKAAEQGEVNAQFSLGWCYEFGKGVSQSYYEAVKWYRKAAEQGEAQAQHNLGLCYYNGKGVSQSNYEAVKWYRKAAEQGHAGAQCNLGLCYYNGKGVSQSYSEAVKWYLKAAEQGNSAAQYNLGWCYQFGKGVSKSTSDAVKWYRKAAAQGDQMSKDALKRLGY